MKTNLKWNLDKVALYFFLGVMGICLILPIGWVITSTFQEYLSKPKVVQVFTVVTENSLAGLVKDELSAFQLQYSNEIELRPIVKEFNPEDAIKYFTKNSNSVLLLSRQLTEAELTTLSERHISITQETVAQKEDIINPSTIYLIKSSLPSEQGQGFTNFMFSDKGQTVALKNGFQRGKKSLDKVG